MLFSGLAVVFEPGRGREIFVAPFKSLFPRPAVVGFLCHFVETGVRGRAFPYGPVPGFDVRNRGPAAVWMKRGAFYRLDSPKPEFSQIFNTKNSPFYFGFFATKKTPDTWKQDVWR